QRPTEKEFADCCNEFWWVSTYVAKGLCRDEIIYAKYMLEVTVREMFLKIIEWYIGIKKNFSGSFGIHGRNIKSHIPVDLYQKILLTYPASNTESIWKSIFIMTELFDDLAQKISVQMNFRYNYDEGKNVRQYLHAIYTLGK
ncbi:MAG TPA: aminoglycoside 6-adenylyltransferase, partial [Chitinophagaceae bacterium]